MRFRFAVQCLAMILMPFAASAADRVVALGDSLTAGYGLNSGEDYATQLETALRKNGLDVKVDNAGVSGDTTAGGLARLEWSVSGDPVPALVIVSLGANDMLRALDPATTRANLEKILKTLADKKIPAVLFGMRAPLNLPAAYRRQFDTIFPELAEQFDIPLYPFFLEGVAMKPDLNLADGVHPTKKGVGVLVEKTLPVVEKALKD